MDRFGFEAGAARRLDEVGNRDFRAGQHVVVDELRDREVQAVMPGDDDQTAETRWLKQTIGGKGASLDLHDYVQKNKGVFAKTFPSQGESASATKGGIVYGRN